MEFGRYRASVDTVLITGFMTLALLVGGAMTGHAAAPDNGAENARLAESASPYLRSHAGDLVQWHSWGEAAFAEARRLDRPIMVSFGYTACHWCHVMQETHFNDPVLAAGINENYVAVLVDRERRPALDEAYMMVTEVLTRRGGWPNTVFMTPDRKPFYGTAYVEPQQFQEILAAVTSGWSDDRDALVAEAEQMATLLTTYMTRKEAAQAITPPVLAAATRDLVATFDEFSGGIGEAPKFFQQPVLMFLLQQAERTGDKAALAVVELTLRSVLSGGIHDHIEGGLHRYAVDQEWRVPHFEKMLYDQALMAEAFTSAYRITGNPDYAAMARKTFDYVLADLTAPDGGFYSTRDADSEGEEGTYYVWTPEELQAVLGAEDGAFALETFGAVADGEFAGKVILNIDDVEPVDRDRVERLFESLAKARASRTKPQRDEKIVASWNGMAIAALAGGALILSEPRYGVAAVKAGNFIWNNMRLGDGGLVRSYFDGAGEVDGVLEDYAHLARAFLFLFDLTEDGVWMERAKTLAGDMTARFEDAETGDFYAMAGVTGFGRIKPRSDVDHPSGNAVALDVLARLARRSDDPAFARKAEKAISALSGIALKTPAGGVSILAAADRFLHGETGSLQYAGNGAVRVEVAPSADRSSVLLRVEVAEGWHVNADRPLEDHLIPTSLQVKADGNPDAAEITYPEPLTKSLAFNEKPMALLEGSFEINARLKPAATQTGTGTATLQVQTCSDEICLLPETLQLRFAWPEKQ